MTDFSPVPVARQQWADVIKGVLIILVVLWHVIMKSYLQIDWQIGVPIPGVWGLFGDVIWPFLMPLFLLVSGYFAANALTRPWSVVVRTRVIRFLYLYLLWSLIHMAALWAFPEFPTLVPRGVSEFVEFVTISPPNTWYLYALAVYFLLAKLLSRIPSWIIIAAAVVLSIAVAAGYVEISSNRGSLLYNFTFFLLGLHLAPQIRLFVTRVTARTVLLLIAGFLLVFGVMRITGTETVPGVWFVVSMVGVAMGLAVAPRLASAPFFGDRLAALGRRSLPIYLLHMPLLAVADVVAAELLSGSRVAVQLVAAVALPVVLTALLVAVCVLLDRILIRDRATWLFDLPRRLSRLPRPTREPAGKRVVPWRSTAAVAVLVACGVAATSATAIAGCSPDLRPQAATQSGQVSIGAVGDVLMYNIGNGMPSDGGAGYFSEVAPWFSQDLVTGNLEQVISEDTGYVKCAELSDCLEFRTTPESARYLEGFDLMNMANNHTSDFGPEGYANTRTNLAANGIDAVGERNEIQCTKFGEITVAVVGFAPYRGTNSLTDLSHARKVVAAAAASADIVIVHAHMGSEGPSANAVTPGSEQMYGENRGDPIAFSHAVVDAGADLVIGHGPHTLRGMEFYQGRLIAYSLGNFGGGGVFGAEQATRYGVYLDISLNADGTFVRGQAKSITFDFEGGKPVPDEQGRAATLVDQFGQRDFPNTAPHIGADGSLTPAG